jgi:hypothetical protein
LDGDQQNLQPTSLKLAPINNSNIYARRHSAHTCPITEERHASTGIPPPVPLRPPAVPKRTHVPPSVNTTETAKMNVRSQAQPPPPIIPPLPKSRALPPIPTVDNKPRPPIRHQISSDSSNLNVLSRTYDLNRNASPKQPAKLPCTFEFNSVTQDFTKIPPAPVGPPPPAPKTCHKPNISPASKVGGNQQCNGGRVSVRQDSGISSDSFSQTSSPSYTTKTMETPLLPPKTPVRQQNGILTKAQNVEDDTNGNTTITKSASTPASLQTIVRFHNGSNMSLHHRIIRDMRRPSSHYARRLKLRFRFAQVIINAIALFAIGAGMAAYFKGTYLPFGSDKTTQFALSLSFLFQLIHHRCK